MKRVLPLLLAMVLLLAACAEAPETEPDDFLMAGEIEDAAGAAQPIRSFTLPIHTGQSLDPITCGDGLQQTVAALLYEGLFTLTPSFETEYCLCDSYEYDAERFVYTFHLREGVTFSDGAALTARDVVATYARAQESARYAARFASVASIRYQGTDTVRIALTRADASFPALLDIPIVRRGTETQAVPAGTGAYLYITEGAQDYLKSNADWWRGQIQPLVRIELTPVKDEDTAAYRFSSGEVQLLSTDLLSGGSLSSASGTTVTAADTTTLLYLGLRCGGALESAALRQAIGQGVDREGLVSGYLSGYARPASFPISPASPLYPAEQEQSYQLSRYASALVELGYGAEDEGGSAQSLTLLVCSDSAEKQAIAEAIAAKLSQQRVSVTVKALPWEQYLAALQNGKFDLYLAEVRLTANWDVSSLIGSGGSLNYGGYSDEQMDRLLAQFRAAQGDERGYVATQLGRYLAQQMPIVPLCFRTVSILTQTSVLSDLTPTESNPFYGLENWVVTLSK